LRRLTRSGGRDSDRCATFITTALENGAQLEDVQKAAGHRDPGNTKLYDRYGYNPEKAASFFATY
jgi:integrase/recombinase XerD